MSSLRLISFACIFASSYLAIPMNITKLLVVMFASLAFAASLHAEEGTLTLSGDEVLFVTASGTKRYTVAMIGGPVLEGTKVTAFVPKQIVKDGKEIDVSELTLENTADGSQLMLVNKAPLPVTRTGEGDQTIWKPLEK